MPPDTEGKRILVVDDEPDILDFIQYNLEKEGYRVALSTNGKETLRISKTFRPHLILLDVMMPEMDGIETCTELRRIPVIQNTLIAFLTARGEDYSQIAGLDAGADDYIAKPIKPKVLSSRIKALLRRPGSTREEASRINEAADIRVDREKYVVTKGERDLTLPRKEFELLDLFISNPGKVFSREQILNRIWGQEVVVGDRTIDVHIRKLREKIGEEHIQTIKGVGYKFE